MTAFQNHDQAVSGVIELYRSKDYSESVLTALKELLMHSISGNTDYEALAAYFDKRLQVHGVHYDSANVYRLMMNALLAFFDYNEREI
jgi:hypothetical protein